MQDDQRRAPPRDMPRTAAPPSRDALRGRPKPQSGLPQQAPITDEPQPKPPAKWRKIVARALAGVLLAALLALGYVFLLLGEPDEESKLTPPTAEQAITMPMSAMEYADEQSLQNLADAFGEPVLALAGSGLAMVRARVSDTAYAGGYARRAAITYALDTGETLTVESVRPVAAATLWRADGYVLESGRLYALAGNNAAWMQNAATACVFGQSDAAAYAVLCPVAQGEQLRALLRYTTLLLPTTTPQ